MLRTIAFMFFECFQQIKLFRCILPQKTFFIRLIHRPETLPAPTTSSPKLREFRADGAVLQHGPDTAVIAQFQIKPFFNFYSYVRHDIVASQTDADAAARHSSTHPNPDTVSGCLRLFLSSRRIIKTLNMFTTLTIMPSYVYGSENILFFL